MKYDLRKSQKAKKASILFAILAVFFLPTPFSLLLSPAVFAQTLTSAGSVDVTKPGFQIIVCDGPAALNELSTHTMINPTTGKPEVFPPGYA